MFDGINTIFSWVFAKFLPWNRYIFYLSTPKINGLCALALAACSRRLGEKRRVQKKNSRIQTTQNKLTVILAFYFVYIMILHNCLGRQTFLVYIYIYIGSSWLVICVVICYNQKNLVVSASEMRFGTTFLGHPT